MATSVLDAPAPTPAVPPARRPVPVLALAAVSLLQAVGLLAAGLTGLEGLLTATPQPPGALVAGVLGGLATWIVACAAGGLAVVDGSGRGLPAAVAAAEVALVAALAVGVLAFRVDVPAALPLPALAVLAVAATKLGLLSAPSTLAWVAVRPPAPARPTPVAHPRVRLATVALIGAALTAVAACSPVPAEAPPASAVSGG